MATTTLDRQYSEDPDKRPRYLNLPCPDKYRYICGRCSKRWGEPDVLGWIDIVRCEKCDAKIRKHEN